MTRAAAVALTVALTTTTTTPPPARANPIDDFNVAALLRKAKYFLGPLQLMLDRLVALERVEASLAAEDLVSELGKATLDCVNPRGPLASYANVRDVCTLNILVKSATRGPAVVNPPGTIENANVVAAQEALIKGYDALALELGRAPVGDSRAAAFAECRGLVKEMAFALLGCFRLEAGDAAGIERAFPELFAGAEPGTAEANGAIRGVRFS